ncbi:MAG: hypothetical protein ACXAC5_02645 [Promethearchaeota archaeon]
MTPKGQRDLQSRATNQYSPTLPKYMLQLYTKQGKIAKFSPKNPND